MKEDLEGWCLYKIYDGITERWSPVYCAPTVAAARLECKELSQKNPQRPFYAHHLGDSIGKDLKIVDLPLFDYHVEVQDA